jgi:hypothetical protein
MQNGSCPSLDINRNEWAHDEYLYIVSYSEMVCDNVNFILRYYYHFYAVIYTLVNIFVTNILFLCLKC